MQGCDPQALQFTLLKFRDHGQETINDTDCDIESFLPHLEFEVEFSEPVNEIRSHFFRDLAVMLGS